jgi:uncharacterized protein
MPCPPDNPWRASADGVVVRARLTPKSSKDVIEDIAGTVDGPAIKVRVRAVPEAGAANTALECLIADWLGIAKRRVTLISGGKSRITSLALSGPSGTLIDALEQRTQTRAKPTP